MYEDIHSEGGPIPIRGLKRVLSSFQAPPGPPKIERTIKRDKLKKIFSGKRQHTRGRDDGRGSDEEEEGDQADDSRKGIGARGTGVGRRVGEEQDQVS